MMPAPQPMLHAPEIVRLHDTCTRDWHLDRVGPANPAPLDSLVQPQHRANFDLWHAEDEVRDPAASDATIVAAKRHIDRLNQTRNDLVEQIDHLLLTAAGPQNPDSPLHSETPGMIIDRLSILSLKLFHTAEEAARPTATEDHRRQNTARLAILHTQRDDLAAALDALWAQVLAGERRFKLYRQMKMYNDPGLNPVLYRRTAY